MALINVASLDFVDIRNSIKDQIRTNPNFTDYDFEGSTLSFLIDILAYNTYISSFNANMLSNEVFIDSATIRENVVALARNIGYLPRPKTCSTTKISFFIDTSQFPSNPQTITLKKGTVATSSGNFNNQSFVFSIPEDITVPVIRNQASFNNITIYEGTFVEESFTYSSSDPNQRIILSNAGVDYNTLVVKLREQSVSTTSLKYNRSDSLSAIDGNSRIYFLQEVEDERYEILFGDGIFGKQLLDQSTVDVSYIVTNGSEGNNVSRFSFAGTLFDNDGVLVSRDISEIFASNSSSGGLDIESVKSIKKYAPRIYASQNRAVTSNDYSTIVRSIYPEADFVSSFGGEELDPPRYGKVYITIKSTNGFFVSPQVKQNIVRELKKYSVAGIVPEILDVKLLYVMFESRVFYNSSFSGSPNDLKTKVIDNLNEFSISNEFNKYGAKFKYSKFLNLIDNSDRAITSNVTKIEMKRVLQPLVNRLAEYEICFKNKFLIRDKSGYNIRSSGFKVTGISDTVYLGDVPIDDNKGNLFLFTYRNNNPSIVRSNVGTIDYINGEIRISAINIVSTTIVKTVPIIEFIATPALNDIFSVNELLLQMDVASSTVDLIDESISPTLQDFQRKYIV